MPCNRSRVELDGLLEKGVDKPTLYPSYFFKNKDGTKMHPAREDLDDDIDRCKKCGCTIDEHGEAAAARTGAHVNQDTVQGIALLLLVQSLDQGPASCVEVIFDTGCNCALLLKSDDFDRVVAGAQLKTSQCSERLGGLAVTQKAFAHVQLRDIAASAECSIFKSDDAAVSLFGLPLMELMHIRCNPDKSVSKCSEVFMGYRCYTKDNDIGHFKTSPVTGVPFPGAAAGAA